MLSNIKHFFRILIGHKPWLVLPIIRHIGRLEQQQIICSDTEILIEGAAGSANTFAIMAFVFAQTSKIRFAGHTHIPAQVIQAINWKIPVLVLLRNPFDAVSSLANRERELSETELFLRTSQTLDDYIHFYRSILPYSGQFVIGLFEDVVNDYGKVIERVNRKYGTHFVPFKHNEENMQKCFGLPKTLVSSDEKLMRKNKVKRFMTERLRNKYDEALFVYKKLVDDASVKENP